MVQLMDKTMKVFFSEGKKDLATDLGLLSPFFLGLWGFTARPLSKARFQADVCILGQSSLSSVA